MSERPEEVELGLAAQCLPEVGREAILAKLQDRQPAPGVEPTGLLARPAPVFVTLRIGAALRGCVGSLEARCANLVEETMDRACAAAFEDTRFSPLELEELESASIEVSILGPLEPVASHEQLDPARFGVEVSDGAGRRAVLLPGIEGIRTAERQLALTREKAGIPMSAEVAIRRFSVVKVP